MKTSALIVSDSYYAETAQHITYIKHKIKTQSYQPEPRYNTVLLENDF